MSNRWAEGNTRLCQSCAPTKLFSDRSSDSDSAPDNRQAGDQLLAVEASSMHIPKKNSNYRRGQDCSNEAFHKRHSILGKLAQPTMPARGVIPASRAKPL
jgi:hypothetical protein